MDTRLSTDYIELIQFDVSVAGPHCKVLVGDLDGDGAMELLFVQADGGIDDRYVPHQVQALTAYHLSGELLWQVGTPTEDAGGLGSDFPAQIYDWDRDGANEVLCVMNKQFLALDGATGATKRTLSLPGDEAHDCIIICNLRGTEHAQDIILKDRYRTLWAMDYEWNVLWSYEGNPGHYPWVFDFDKDGKDDVIAGYDVLTPQGELKWSTLPLEDHADCIWVGDVQGRGDQQIVIGGSVTVMYDIEGNELWRHDGSIESQHIALGKFRADLPGLQIAGLDRIVRGDTGGKMTETGKDSIFLLDQNGQEIWKEERTTNGWLTIIETMRQWDDSGVDYILAYRRGGGVLPTLYNGHMEPVAVFPVDGYVVHADLVQSGFEQIVIYNAEKAAIYSSVQIDIKDKPVSKGLIESKRLYSSTLYPGGEYV